MTEKRTALLIIDHGSRYEGANNMIYDVKTMMETLRPELIIDVAHMELADPNIEAGFKSCVDRGATHVIAHPYMLSPGRHATKDIPNLVKKAAAKYPKVTCDITEHLGVNPKIGEVILEKAGLL